MEDKSIDKWKDHDDKTAKRMLDAAIVAKYGDRNGNEGEVIIAGVDFLTL